MQAIFVYYDASNGRLEALRQVRRYATQKRTCWYARTWMWGLVLRTTDFSEVTFLATTEGMKIPSWTCFSLMVRISTVRAFLRKEIEAAAFPVVELWSSESETVRLDLPALTCEESYAAAAESELDEDKVKTAIGVSSFSERWCQVKRFLQMTIHFL